METGKIVFTGKSKSGIPLLIRYPKESDAKIMMEFINTLSAEQTYIGMQGEQKTLAFEQEFLKKQCQLIHDKQSVFLLVFTGDTLIGEADLRMGEAAFSHVGGLGISLAKEYRGKGIGSILMQYFLEESEKNIDRLRILTLQAFSANEAGTALYKKFGFQIYGRLPEGLFRRGEYYEEISMYKKIR